VRPGSAAHPTARRSLLACAAVRPHQTKRVQALWHSLAADYPLYYVQLHDKRLRVLGRQVSSAMREAFHTRMLLLGKNGCLEHFVHQTGCQH